MIPNVQHAVVYAGLMLLAVCVAPAHATKIDKGEIKGACGQAGGSYSEGSNYARCEYSNGDSYTCNTDVNQCESCTGGKCTVSIGRPGTFGGYSGPVVNAPATTPSTPTPTATPKPLKAMGAPAPVKKAP
jgi:hypothetical protein